MRYPAAVFVALLAFTAAAAASAAEPRLRSPRWMVELKGGQFEPDLDDYATFYGDERTGFGALALAYRLTHWLELGAELGYASDRGVGQLPENELLGGATKYLLAPAQAFASVRGDFSENQLFVPYAGIGLAMGFYKQEIDDQSDRDGNTDLGYSTRLGVALSFNRLDPRAARIAARGPLKKTYAFLEAQQFSAEQDGTDLGGLIYMLGLRFEFDYRRDEQRAEPPAQGLQTLPSSLESRQSN